MSMNGTASACSLLMMALRLVLAPTMAVGLALADAPPTRLAIISDYGSDNGNELAVANLVKTNFRPEFVVSAGDNNYIGASRIDDAIGKYYQQFIGNYAGRFGTGALSNCFFPALGNHDYDASTGYTAHTNYFTLPGNERYYDFVRGPVHLFALDSDGSEPDGNSADSTQAAWLRASLASCWSSFSSCPAASRK